METVRAAGRSLVLILFGVALAMAFARHEEPPQRLPLVHASYGLPPCQLPPADDGDEPEPPAGSDIV
jgi:hypothetical protein